MKTTIQVSEHMLMMLKQLKEQERASSYEEALEKSMRKLRLKESMSGYLGKKYGKVSREEILKDLRDKHDRY